MLLSCCYNIFTLQMILIEAPQSPNLISFMQILFLSVEGFVRTTKFMTVKSRVPLWEYVKVSATNFASISCQSLLIYTHVDIPLQHLSRASTLIGTLLLGTFVYKKSYRTSKFISVALITFGITAVFVASSDSMHRMVSNSNVKHTVERTSFFQGISTIVLVLAAIYSAALLGIQQENLFIGYGISPKELLFYCHVLLLPWYAILVPDIMHQISIFNKSAPVFVLRGSLGIPKLWLFTVANVATQYVCTRTIFHMISKYTSLTVSLMMTLRKFVSLVVSLVHFDNNFTSSHWIGTFFIFSGTLLFVDEIFDGMQSFLTTWGKPTTSRRPRTR